MLRWTIEGVLDWFLDAAFLSHCQLKKLSYLCIVGTKKQPTVILDLLIQRTFRKA